MVKASVQFAAPDVEPVEVEGTDRDDVVSKVHRMAYNPSRRRPRAVRVQFLDNNDVRWITV